MTRPSYRDFAVSVLASEDVSPTFRRLTLAGPDLHECGAELLDQRIKLVLMRPGQRELLFPADDSAGWYERLRGIPAPERPAIRTYTLSGVDADRGTVTVDLACRPVHGPASEFATRAAGGEPLLILAPDALSPQSKTDGIAWNPGSAREVLLVGDETALPAIRNIVNSLPPSRFGTVVLELPCVADAVGLEPGPGVDVHVAQRDGRVGAAAEPFLRTWLAGRSTAPADDVADPDEELLWEEATGSGSCYAWVAGEAGWVRDLRRLLLGSGAVTKQQASFMGYWKQGVSGAA